MYAQRLQMLTKKIQVLQRIKFEARAGRSTSDHLKSTIMGVPITKRRQFTLLNTPL